MQFIAERGIENGLQFGNPDFSQSSGLPLYKEELLFFPKLRRFLQNTSHICSKKGKNEGKVKKVSEKFAGFKEKHYLCTRNQGDNPKVSGSKVLKEGWVSG